MSKNLQHLNAVTQLRDNDSVMNRLIGRYGNFDLQPHDRHFEELVNSIVSQQLSVRAAQKIWGRFLGFFDNSMPSPERILAADDDSLRSVGLSYQKVGYIKDLSAHVIDGRLELHKATSLSNDRLISELTSVRGIGTWSAHMFMIFSLGRLDVLAWGDLGIRKSAMQLYSLPRLPSQLELEALSDEKGWSPFESVACWYLWKNLDNKS